MSKTIDDVLIDYRRQTDVYYSEFTDGVITEAEWYEIRERIQNKTKQALYELFEAEAETIELTHKDDTRIWRQAKKYVSLDTIAKLLGITNADQ